MTSKQVNVLQKRLSLLNSLENYINESIYYRSYNKEMNSSSKYIVWNYNQESGKVSIK